MSNYIVQQDGNSWFATTDDFIDLQASEVAFGNSPVSALANYLAFQEKKELELNPKHCHFCGSAVHDTNEHEDLARLL